MNFMTAIECFLNMQLPPYIHGNIKHSVKRITTVLVGRPKMPFNIHLLQRCTAGYKTPRRPREVYTIIEHHQLTHKTNMLEPVALKDFFITFFSSALIIMAGASYALLFAWSKAKPRLSITISAYLSYAVLLASVYQLTLAANLDGYWRIISYLMVIGYFFAPIAIWHLCKQTHDDPDLITTMEKENE